MIRVEGDDVLLADLTAVLDHILNERSQFFQERLVAVNDLEELALLQDVVSLCPPSMICGLQLFRLSSFEDFVRVINYYILPRAILGFRNNISTVDPLIRIFMDEY